MKPLKFSLAGLVVLLAIAVAYGYGCGGDDGKEGSGAATTAAETDGTSDNAASTEAGDGNGDGTAEDGASDGDGGGGDGDGGSGGAPLSKAAYVKQGDAICEKVPTRYSKTLTELEKEDKATGKKTSPAEANLKAAVPPLYTAAEELEGLTPPSGDEAKAEAIVAALESAAKGLEAKPTSELSGPKSPFAEFQKLTREYGFKGCSQL